MYFKDKIYSIFNTCFHQPYYLYLHNPTERMVIENTNSKRVDKNLALHSRETKNSFSFIVSCSFLTHTELNFGITNIYYQRKHLLFAALFK